ncbi:BQ5605_C001g00162 [Microbotryum silenes-dioicae]|uniref:BQ5605_C001g00162 protein n=1 Tax=Microbotryum silenes-dioicae TaxID=796604 RepID=A0A2X0MPW4_9BASI|nr:BQ5605_C001g00162 [Microbotryum silenes-dioicae]
MASSSSSRLGICQTCNVTAARYSCPACQFPSCSLGCSTSHKVRLDCSGIAPPVWSLPLKASDMSWGPLMRDQSYIASVSRKSEHIGRQLVKDKLIPSLRANDGDQRLDNRNDRENKMVYEARKQGVDLVLLPKGMTRRVKNASRWDPKSLRMEWVLDMIFQANPAPASPSSSSPAPAPPTTYTTGPQPSTSTLHAALSAAFAQRDKKSKNKKLNQEDQDWIALQKKWLASFQPIEIEPAPSCEPPPPPTGGAAIEATSSQVAPGPVTQVEGREDSVTLVPFTTSGRQTDDVVPSLLEEDAAADALGEDDDEYEADEEVDESPFILLLSLFTRPPEPLGSPSEEDHDGHAPPQTHHPTPAVRALTNVTPRRVFVISPHLPSLQSALVGATILECPCFELWSREAFLRARLQGKIRVVDQPRSLEGVQQPDSGGRWERGRGRSGGRGRGGRGGRGRGGSSQRGFGSTSGRGRRGGGGGGGDGRDGHPQREEGSAMSRGPDNGWGKRAAAASGHDKGGSMPKKARE